MREEDIAIPVYKPESFLTWELSPAMKPSQREVAGAQARASSSISRCQTATSRGTQSHRLREGQVNWPQDCSHHLPAENYPHI